MKDGIFWEAGRHTQLLDMSNTEYQLLCNYEYQTDRNRYIFYPDEDKLRHYPAWAERKITGTVLPINELCVPYMSFQTGRVYMLSVTSLFKYSIRQVKRGLVIGSVGRAHSKDRYVDINREVGDYGRPFVVAGNSKEYLGYEDIMNDYGTTDVRTGLIRIQMHRTSVQIPYVEYGNKRTVVDEAPMTIQAYLPLVREDPVPHGGVEQWVTQPEAGTYRIITSIGRFTYSFTQDKIIVDGIRWPSFGPFDCNFVGNWEKFGQWVKYMAELNEVIIYCLESQIELLHQKLDFQTDIEKRLSKIIWALRG